MSDGAREQPEDGRPPAEEAALSARLQRLGERLDQAKTSRASGVDEASRRGDYASGLARGLRLSSELVGAVIIGAVLGWLVDRWAGTRPWGLIVLLLLGFAGGVHSIVRSVSRSTPADHQG